MIPPPPPTIHRRFRNTTAFVPKTPSPERERERERANPSVGYIVAALCCVFRKSFLASPSPPLPPTKERRRHRGRGESDSIYLSAAAGDGRGKEKGERGISPSPLFPLLSHDQVNQRRQKMETPPPSFPLFLRPPSILLPLSSSTFRGEEFTNRKSKVMLK